ncbi:MAG TPA: fibronectin type III domain-containing protein [Bryobacteraceae bacterium]
MGPDHVTIVWSTRENLSGEVRYSTDQSFSKTASVARVRQFPVSVTKMAQSFTQYQVDLTGLTPGTQYSYRVVMSDGVNITPDPAPQFRTASPGPFTFLVVGDSGLGSAAQRDIAQLMIAENPSLVLHVGDIAYENGTFDEFTNNYFEYY